MKKTITVDIYKSKNYGYFTEFPQGTKPAIEMEQQEFVGSRAYEIDCVEETPKRRDFWLQWYPTVGTANCYLDKDIATRTKNTGAEIIHAFELREGEKIVTRDSLYRAMRKFKEYDTGHGGPSALFNAIEDSI